MAFLDTLRSAFSPRRTALNHPEEKAIELQEKQSNAAPQKLDHSKKLKPEDSTTLASLPSVQTATSKAIQSIEDFQKEQSLSSRLNRNSDASDLKSVAKDIGIGIVSIFLAIATFPFGLAVFLPLGAGAIIRRRYQEHSTQRNT